ncbi:MAG: hemagglutinin repeat-containing protein, partial [Elusimicrobiota bacterium]|nr:hemagglutinin repeat-containing protein [Elusimicrobiota bacterium]
QGNYGIFRSPIDPTSNYFYETDPMLIDLSKFLGSDYFMNRLGLDPNTIDLKFLGDAFMEHEMLKKTLEQIGLFQNTNVNIDEYINSLYDNLSKEKMGELGLEFGQDLTEEQKDNLTEDIIWYIKQEITLPNGENIEALVPQVYFAQKTLEELAEIEQQKLALQEELSIKQAEKVSSDKANEAGNKALQDEINKLQNEAKNEAKAKIADEAKSYIQNNQDEVNKLIQEQFEEYKNQSKKEAYQWLIDEGIVLKQDLSSYSISSISGIFGAYLYSDAEVLQKIKEKVEQDIVANLEQEKLESYSNEFLAPKLESLDKEKIYQEAYNKTYEKSYPLALEEAKKQNIQESNTSSVIQGNNVVIQAIDPTKESVLNNAGSIIASDTLAIKMDQVNNIASAVGGGQATLRAGNLLYIDTVNDILGTDGKINNISGFIGATNSASLLYLNTGDLNNITHSQQESFSYTAKNFDYRMTETNIGNIAQIASGGDMTLSVTNDLFMMGSTLFTGNGDMNLDVGNDIVVTTVQNYNDLYEYKKNDGGTFGTTTTRENQTTTLENISSNILSGNNLNMNAGNDIISVGTNFYADNDINMIADNDLMLLNATDYNYNYSYYKEEKFDLGSAIANVVASVAVGALTGGFGAAVMAGASSAYGASQMTKGREDISMKYDETTVGSSLTAGNNVNIKSGNDTTMISTGINVNNDLDVATGGELFVGTAVEKHDSMESHEKFGGDILGAALSGAITGLATGLAVGSGDKFGAWLGGKLAGTANFATNALSSALTFGGNTAMATTFGVLSGASTAINYAPTNQIMTANRDLESSETYTALQVSSNFNVGNNLNINTNQDLTIASSNVNVGNNAVLNSETGDVNILSVTEKQTTINKEIDTSKFGNFGFTYSDTSVGLGGSYDVTTTVTTTNTNQEKSSNLNIGNNLMINANNDVNIIASNIVANNDIDINAETGNINVLSKEQLQTIRNLTEVDTISFGLSVGNTWWSAAKGAYDMADTASRGNHDTTEGYTNSFLQAGHTYMAYKGAAELAENISSVKDLTSFTNLGFSLGANISVSHTESETNVENITNKGSNIISRNGDINLTAENDINIKGSNINANSDDETKGNINLISNDGTINITETQSRSHTETETTTFTNGIVNTSLNNIIDAYANSSYDYLIFNKTPIILPSSFGYNKGDYESEVIKNDNNTSLKGNNVNIVTKENGQVTITGLSEEERANFNITDNQGNNTVNVTINELEEKNTEEFSNWGINVGLGNGLTNNLLNTTFSYSDSEGYDFSVSPMSFYSSLIATEETLEFGRETIEKGTELLKLEDGDNKDSKYNMTISLLGTGISQVFSAPEGFLDYFIENDSKLIVNGKETDDAKSAKDYYVNGIMNKREDVDVVSTEKDAVVRYNPTSGFLGDLLESGLGKIFNGNGITAYLGSMNRIVAGDLAQRSDMEGVNNSFHSQGTIIGVGAMNILSSQGVTLDSSQIMWAVGPAVAKSTWENTANEVLVDGNIRYYQTPGDYVRIVTTPTEILSSYKGTDINSSYDGHNFRDNALYYSSLSDRI